MQISIKLKEILKERDLSRRELARVSGLRPTRQVIFVQTVVKQEV